MQSKQTPFTRFAIFKDNQLIERVDGNIQQAKARLEYHSNMVPDHNWWFVTYENDDELSTPASWIIN